MKKLTMIAMALLSIAAIGCSNTGSNNSNPGYNPYGACQSYPNGAYPGFNQMPYNNGYQTGMPTSCYNNGYNTYGGTLGNTQCVGQYYFLSSSGQWYTGMCQGYNCSGYTLYTANGQQVRCM
jgi:hypothetical protein